MNVSIPFTDVASDAWYYNVVSQAYGKGLISGMSDTEFSPESSVMGAHRRIELRQVLQVAVCPVTVSAFAVAVP